MDARQRLLGAQLGQLKLQHGAVQPMPGLVFPVIQQAPCAKQSFRTGQGLGAAWVAAHENVGPSPNHNA